MHPEVEIRSEKLSYWKGDDSDPLKNLTIGQLVEQAAERYVDRIAISAYGGNRFTFAEVLEKIDILAAAFANLGLKRGNHVALWGFSTIEWYLSFLAAFRAGLVVVNLNPLYQTAELLTCLEQADVDALIMDDQLGDHNFYNILKRGIPDVEKYDNNVHITNEVVPSLKTIIVMSKQSFKGTFKWYDLFSSVTEDQRLKVGEIQADSSPFDVCNMQMTSGTTSKPKCVQLSHRSLINAAYIAGKRKGLFDKVHWVCLQVPFFHAYGAVHGILSLIASGCVLVLPYVKFSPNKSIDCIIEEKCTIVYGTPTMHNDLITTVRTRASIDDKIYEKISSVETFQAGGAMCSPELIKNLKKTFRNSRFMSGWGMTETSATGFSTLLQDTEDIILSTVGKVTEHVEVKVIDEKGEIVPLGVPGELCCKGYQIMNGYYKDPVKTKEVLDEDGWLRTGDKFILRENGYGEIVGRIKDIIIRGGENIAPKEIEQLLIEHPDIVDVEVYGVSDTRLGEAVAAAVIKSPNSSLTERDIQEYCKGMIASYKIPQYVVFVEKFPKTMTGKIQKVKLKEMTEKQLHLPASKY
ncbi:medium-chain acyl-CoA ligase ACSF2, mitochondrial-like [Planococcus citri]|uniref:medium-chain acyl-CoA ligase ACSF2, mitochondrial-like n=1 Tax=Planococcus citri TaxID=170843 RepID=UPI0031F77570